MEQYMEKALSNGLFTLEDRKSLINSGWDVEEFLKKFVNRGYLLHGSTRSRLGILKPNRRGNVFAADAPEVALLKAIFRHGGKGINLRYPMRINGDHPMKAELEFIGPSGNDPKGAYWTLRDTGSVYVLPSEGFTKREGTWEYTKPGPADILAEIEVTPVDFKYEIYNKIQGFTIHKGK